MNRPSSANMQAAGARGEAEQEACYYPVVGRFQRYERNGLGAREQPRYWRGLWLVSLPAPADGHVAGGTDQGSVLLC